MQSIRNNRKTATSDEERLDLITKHNRTTGKKTPNNNKYEFYLKLKTLNLLRRISNAYVWNDTKNYNL